MAWKTNSPTISPVLTCVNISHVYSILYIVQSVVMRMNENTCLPHLCIFKSLSSSLVPVATAVQQAMEDLLEDEDEDYEKDDKVIISLSLSLCMLSRDRKSLGCQRSTHRKYKHIDALCTLHFNTLQTSDAHVQMCTQTRTHARIQTLNIVRRLPEMGPDTWSSACCNPFMHSVTVASC